jgi:hypothetical protein
MPFEKGKNKTGGRKKGLPNKKTAILDTFAQSVVDGGMEKFKKELNKLEGKDFVNAYLSLFEYVKPKLSRMEMKAEVEAKIKKVGYGKEE